jgi:hypothetical protein|tara:strand:+ start:84 stop:302 length:219 start_codon:yes stop_codon:yes gene_type:complete
MPRIYASNNDPVDFCVYCFPAANAAAEEYGVGARGVGPDDRGDCYAHDAAHPPYSSDDYVCNNCNDTLTDSD